MLTPRVRPAVFTYAGRLSVGRAYVNVVMDPFQPGRDRERHASDGESIPVEIAREIAAARDVDPFDLPPLNGHVDIDALTSLIRTTDQQPSGHLRVSFRYHGCDVEVRGDGTVDVAPTADSDAPADQAGESER